jgi:5'-3' exonuclease
MKLLLVDLPSILHPIWHMSAKEPDPDHASQQTVARVHSLASGFDGVAVCCDSPKSFRKELSPEYKANRPQHDERLVHQLRLAKEQLRADGFPVWEVPGFEADDVIASAVDQVSGYVHNTTGSPPEVVIVSGDKDLLQLVTTDTVTVRKPDGKTYGFEETAARFVPPYQMRDYLILVGDAADNVKGVPGIGDKRARELLRECGSIVGIYERIRSGKCIEAPFTPSIVTALKESLVAVELGRKLVQLRDDLEIPFDEILRPRAAPEMKEEAVETQVIDKQTGEVVETAKPPSVPPPPPPAQPIQAVPVEDAKPAVSVTLATVEWNRELEPRSLSQAERLAQHMFISRNFAAYGTREGVLATILAGRELGVGAMASLRGFHIIEGKPSMSSGLMAALILRSGKAKYFRCVKSTNEVAVFRTQRAGDDEPVEVSFSLEDANRAGLVKEKSGWTKYPADMLVARATARLARLVYPDICFGLYTPEELNREDLENYGAAA